MLLVVGGGRPALNFLAPDALGEKAQMLQPQAIRRFLEAIAHSPVRHRRCGQ